MSICSQKIKDIDNEDMFIYQSYYIPLHNLLMELEKLHMEVAGLTGSERFQKIVLLIYLVKN